MGGNTAPPRTGGRGRGVVVRQGEGGQAGGPRDIERIVAGRHSVQRLHHRHRVVGVDVRQRGKPEVWVQRRRGFVGEGVARQTEGAGDGGQHRKLGEEDVVNTNMFGRTKCRWEGGGCNRHARMKAHRSGGEARPRRRRAGHAAGLLDGLEGVGAHERDVRDAGHDVGHRDRRVGRVEHGHRVHEQVHAHVVQQGALRHALREGGSTA